MNNLATSYVTKCNISHIKTRQNKNSLPEKNKAKNSLDTPSPSHPSSPLSTPLDSRTAYNWGGCCLHVPSPFPLVPSPQNSIEAFVSKTLLRSLSSKSPVMSHCLILWLILSPHFTCH